MNRFQQKLERLFPKQPFTTQCPECPLHVHVCAYTTLGNLKCQIEPLTRELNVHLNDFIPWHQSNPIFV